MTTYIIKTMLCSALFVCAYKIFLENERMHQFNRIYLLCSLLLSFIIPAITFYSRFDVLPMLDNSIVNPKIISDLGSQNQSLQINHANYSFSIFLTIYMTVTTLLLFRFIINLKTIFNRARNNSIINYGNSKIVFINENLVPHSFFSYIFINKTDNRNGGIENEILIHELAHVQQKHSFDVLLIEMVQMVFWFNPFLILYRKAIQLNHEFMADEAVINVSRDAVSYQCLLIEKTSSQTRHALTSDFNYSITKKRLIMITKAKSFGKILCRQLTVIPVLAVSIFLFGTKTIAQPKPDPKKVKQMEAPSTRAGVTQELLDEYDKIVSKTKNEKGDLDYRKFSDADKSRLETIYLAMSKEQQATQLVYFMHASGVLPKIIPSKQQIESWKNPKIYGLWIDGKKVDNAELNKYQNTDFSQVFVSKLYGAAKKNVSYYYQVDLMTIEYYDSYKKKEGEDKEKYFMAIRMKGKDKAS